jgi:hypothetical protein
LLQARSQIVCCRDGVLEFGLDPKDPKNSSRIGGLPAAPHPWCLPEGSPQTDVDDLVVFLLTL